MESVVGLKAIVLLTAILIDGSSGSCSIWCDYCCSNNECCSKWEYRADKTIILGVGAIAGIIIAVAIVLAAIVSAAVLCCCRPNQSRNGYFRNASTRTATVGMTANPVIMQQYPKHGYVTSQVTTYPSCLQQPQQYAQHPPAYKDYAVNDQPPPYPEQEGHGGHPPPFIQQ